MEKIIITGGNGFLGSHLTAYFLEQEQPIACFMREGSSRKNLAGMDLEYVQGDVTDLESVTRGFAGYTTVIHNAALSRDWGAYEDFYRVNVTGTMNVLAACREHGINNILMTGSVSSYGEENNDTVKDETCALNSHYPYFLDSLFPNSNNHYRDTKAIATKQAAEWAEKNNLNLTILEPVWIYGERDFHNVFYTYLESVKDKIPVFPGTKKNKFHVVYAGDVARAFYLAWEKKLTGVQKMIIGNSETEYMDRIFRKLCDYAGYKKPVNIPKFLLYPVGFLLELIYSLLRLKNPPLLTRSRVAMFYDNIEYSPRKAEELLGFRNEYSLDAGIKKTIDWYKAEGYL